MKNKLKILALIVFGLVLVLSFGSINSVQAATLAGDSGYNICAGAGWSPLQSMTLGPNQTRTIYFSPMRAGHHKIIFRSSNGAIIKLVPYWSGKTGSGSWGPYYSIYGNIQIVNLETGDVSVKYQFKISETRGKSATIYYQNYCSATY